MKISLAHLFSWIIGLSKIHNNITHFNYRKQHQEF